MKTQISQNIRKLRLNSNMTQEILAEKIGVSVQAVSRWENAVTMPDITLLPIISNTFNVSIDTLFGNNKDDIQRRIDQTYTKLSKAKDINERIATAKELCGEYPMQREPKFILFNELATPTATPENQKEGIKLGYELLATLRSDEYWHRDNIISGMIGIIPENELSEFIGKFTHTSSLDSMLVRRYHWNNEKDMWFEKYAKMMYVELRNYFNGYADKFLKSIDKKDAKKLSESRIKMLNIISEADCPIDSVIGDGKVDIFILWRIEWGIRLAAYNDDAEVSINILSQVLKLYKLIKAHPVNKPIDTRTPFFSPIEMYIKHIEKWNSYSIISSISDIGADGFSMDFFRNRLENKAFDWLKNNEEFQKYKIKIED